MDTLNSLSKGIFANPKGMSGNAIGKRSSKFRIPKTSLGLDKTITKWNDEYEQMWNKINTNIENFRKTRDESHLQELINFVESSYLTSDTQQNMVNGSIYLPVAALLTGINKPDHQQYFKTFTNRMCEREHINIVVLPARDCPNIKSTIEAIVSSVISKKFNFKDDDEEADNLGGGYQHDSEADDDSVGEADDCVSYNNLKRQQYTMSVLRAWYTEQCEKSADGVKPKICIIIPNFEEFVVHVIQDLIQILSNHCEHLPIVLILGVATLTSTIFQSLSVNETTQIKLCVFSSQSAVTSLSKIVEEILLTPEMSFHLSGHVLRSMSDVFLSYDFTISQFIESIKYSMLEHFSQGDEYSLCSSSYELTKVRIAELKKIELENVRKLPSFRAHIEAIVHDQPSNVIQLMNDDEYLRDYIKHLTLEIYAFFLKYHCYLKVLLVLVKDLPLAPLGRNLRSLYMQCNTRDNIVDTELFNNCCRLLEGMAKEGLVAKSMQCMNVIEDYQNAYCMTDDPVSNNAREAFEATLDCFNDLVLELENIQASTGAKKSTATSLKGVENRGDLQQKLLNMAEQDKHIVSAKVKKFVKFVREDVVKRYVPSILNGPPLIELFVFGRSDLLKVHLNGAPRGAIDTALTNPRLYLDCNCCKIDNTAQLVTSMPESSIAYKLLMESGQYVNLYDWLQSFGYILADSEDLTDEVPVMIQAKFARARTELEHLGYIRCSKRKTDHVTKNIW